MNLRFALLAVCALAISSFATSARADVLYTFSGVNDGFGGDGQSVGFTYQVSDFLPTPVTPIPTDGSPCADCYVIYPSQLGSCLNCILDGGPAISVIPSEVAGTPIAGFQFNDNLKQGNFYAFEIDAFDTPDKHSSIDQNVGYSDGTLTVTVINVPEPGSVGLALGGGIVLVMVCLFRRNGVNAPLPA